MTNQTTRRNVITGAAALPLLPASAFAVPVTLPLLPVASYAQPADDPAIEAYEEWRKAYRAFLIALKTRPDDDDPVVDAADDAERAAATRFAETVPTTLAGLAAQISFTPYCFGQVNCSNDDWTEPGNYSFGNWLCDDREDALCRSMRAGIERIAGAVS